MREGEFRDRRLVEVYDAECPWSRDDEFFVSIVAQCHAARCHAARVLDLGCGTGRLALGLARRGHVVTGIDPARASLEAARSKPDADRVTWLEGTSSSAPEAAFDVALMTSHVAQFFVGDDDWRCVLDDVRRALVPGGRVAFDARDPRDRAWERWNPVDSLRRVTLLDGRVVTISTEVTAVEETCTVDFVHTYESQTVSISRAQRRCASERRSRSDRLSRTLASSSSTCTAAGSANRWVVATVSCSSLLAVDQTLPVALEGSLNRRTMMANRSGR